MWTRLCVCSQFPRVRDTSFTGVTVEECKVLLSGMEPHDHIYGYDCLRNTLLLHLTFVFSSYRECATDGRRKKGFVEDVNGQILQITRRRSRESSWKITCSLSVFPFFSFLAACIEIKLIVGIFIDCYVIFMICCNGHYTLFELCHNNKI